MTLFAIFYSWNFTIEKGLSQSVNPSLLTLVALILLIAKYMFYGKKVRIVQLIGAFVSILGIIVLYMSMSK